MEHKHHFENGNATQVGISPARKRFSTDALAGPICKLCSVDWQQVMYDSAVELSAENKSGNLVYAQEYMHLWNAFAARSKIEKLSQCIGERMSNGPIVPVLLAMSSAPNFMIGIRRLSELERIFGPVKIHITQSGPFFEVDLTSVQPDVELPPTFSAPQIIYMQSSCRRFAVKPFHPLSVRIPLSANERDGLIDVFGCRPEFGAPKLVYRTADVLEPFFSENLQLWQKTKTHLLNKTKQVSKKSQLVERLESVLSSLFGHSDPTLSNACTMLKMSRSTLIRQLRSEGTTYQSVLDKLRQDHAFHYLRNTALSNKQIAHLVGYTDTNAFQRAFKKWTGKTPGDTRTQLRQV